MPQDKEVFWQKYQENSRRKVVCTKPQWYSMTALFQYLFKIERQYRNKQPETEIKQKVSSQDAAIAWCDKFIFAHIYIM